MLSKEQIQAAQDYRVEAVDVPEWGGQVFVRTMSARMREQFEMKYVDGKRPENLRASFVTECVCDDQGNLLFAPDDVSWLTEKSAAVVIRLFDAASKLNGLTKNDVDELEGN